MSDRLPKAPDAPLHAVEWRVQGEIDRAGGVRVIAYLDAPTVAELMDDWVGPENWADSYTPVGPPEQPSAMWCHLAVRAADGGWVTKSDLGVPSAMEAAKGLVSDAFKRVAMRKWGAGRNVCALPVLRLTRIDTYDSRGRTHARLTDASHREIAGLLRRKGFAAAAENVRVGGESGPEAAAAYGGQADSASAEAATTLDAIADRGQLAEIARLYERLPAARQAGADAWIAGTFAAAEWETLTRGQAGQAIAMLERALRQAQPLSAEPGTGPQPPVGLSRGDYAELTKAGIGGALRHELSALVSGGRTRSSKELTAAEREALLGWADRIAGGEARVVDEGPGGGPALIDSHTDELLVSALRPAATEEPGRG